jgi:hypothetical protein
MNSRVDIGHVHAKNVSVRDCHFKRSVIFDFSAMDVLLFNTSSFEQILSLEYSEIGDCIAISSCAMGKPPNFLNCRLADDAIQNADRETFRIIKNAFDGVGNNIEANRYFSYEMNALRGIVLNAGCSNLTVPYLTMVRTTGNRCCLFSLFQFCIGLHR